MREVVRAQILWCEIFNDKKFVSKCLYSITKPEEIVK